MMIRIEWEYYSKDVEISKQYTPYLLKKKYVGGKHAYFIYYKEEVIYSTSYFTPFLQHLNMLLSELKQEENRRPFLNIK